MGTDPLSKLKQARVNTFMHNLTPTNLLTTSIWIRGLRYQHYSTEKYDFEKM